MPALSSSLLLLAVTGIVLWLVRPYRFRWIGWLAALPPTLVTGWLLSQLGPISSGSFVVEQYAWAPALGLEVGLRLDGLAILFGLIITGVGAGVALYTGYYFEDDERMGYFYLLLYLFMASMLGLVWSDNLLALFVFWEGTSITSYLLIAFNHANKEAREGGRRAFIVTALGGLALLAGAVLLGQAAGTYTISEIVAGGPFTSHPLYPAALVLLLLAAFTKSAQFPFHFWLPGAMAAPTPASAYLHSATMVKAGVFLLARLHPALADSPAWFWSLLIVGGITMLLGPISALRYHDMKALLAYATVGQLGLLTALLAFSSHKAYIAAVVGVLAHALYKGPLFLVAGIVDHATGSRDLRRFAALWRGLPLLAATAVVAGVSMAGLPPTFGFLGKETALETGVAYSQVEPLVGWLFLAAVAVSGAFSFAYSAKFVWESFFRPQPEGGQESAHVHHAPSAAFVLAPLALALIGTAIPFVLGSIEGLLFAPSATSIAGSGVDVHLALWHGLTPAFIASLAAIAAGVALFFSRGAVRSALERAPDAFTGVYVFNRLNDGTYALADWVTRTVQGTTMATQISVTLVGGALMALFGVTQLYGGGLPLQFASFQPGVAELLLAAMAIIAALTTVRAASRLGAIISLSVVGVVVMLYFIFFSAPDLALTQLLIEVLTVILLVLVFFRVKPDRLPPMSRSRRLRNAVVAGLMGALGFVLVLFSSGIQVAPSINRYFLLWAPTQGHGANVVNVILVDLRGFDTMGEITVLGIAALGGYALLRAPRLRALQARLAQGAGKRYQHAAETPPDVKAPAEEEVLLS